MKTETLDAPRRPRAPSGAPSALANALKRRRQALIYHDTADGALRRRRGGPGRAPRHGDGRSETVESAASKSSSRSTSRRRA